MGTINHEMFSDDDSTDVYVLKQADAYRCDGILDKGYTRDNVPGISYLWEENKHRQQVFLCQNKKDNSWCLEFRIRGAPNYGMNKQYFRRKEQYDPCTGGELLWEPNFRGNAGEFQEPLKVTISVPSQPGDVCPTSQTQKWSC